jgi:hypothetical protein
MERSSVNPTLAISAAAAMAACSAADTSSVGMVAPVDTMVIMVGFLFFSLVEFNLLIAVDERFGCGSCDDSTRVFCDSSATKEFSMCVEATWEMYRAMPSFRVLTQSDPEIRKIRQPRTDMGLVMMACKYVRTPSNSYFFSDSVLFCRILIVVSKDYL